MLKRIRLLAQEMWVQSLGWEDSPGEENGNPFQYSCLENSMGRGAWWVIVLGFAKSRTWLSFYIVVGGSRSVWISQPCLTAEHTGSRTSPERLAWIVWSLKIHDATGAASITQKSTNPKCGGLEWQGYFLDYFPKVDLIAMIHLGVHMVFRRG